VARRSFTEGALNAALVPGYLRVRESEAAPPPPPSPAACSAASADPDRHRAPAHAADAWVMAVLARASSAARRCSCAVDDARLMMPYCAFVGPAIVMMAC